MGELIQIDWSKITFNQAMDLAVHIQDEYDSLPIDKKLEQECERQNNTESNNQDKSIYDCRTCKNRGYIRCVDYENKTTFIHVCECMQIRRNLKNIDRSGLKSLVSRYTFENYKTDSDYQSDICKSAQEFIKDEQKQWFYIGGQVGAGKTHICTAITKHFLESGKTAKYMLWVDESRRLKAIVNNEEYFDEIQKYKDYQVLYIDDFLKTTQSESPTKADLMLAFELINCRYNNDKHITIFSSERSLDEVLKLDGALGSRIYDRAYKYCINITKDENKNYRLRHDQL